MGPLAEAHAVPPVKSGSSRITLMRLPSANYTWSESLETLACPQRWTQYAGSQGEANGKNPPMELRQLVYLKACPRCNGDLHVSRDMDGTYRECLQCGYMRDITNAIRKHDVQSVEKPRSRRTAAGSLEVFQDVGVDCPRDSRESPNYRTHTEH